MSNDNRLLASALVVVLLAPAAAFADSDLERTAREFARRFGSERVEVSGRTGQTRLSALHFVDAMNQERAARGLRPLKLNSKLSLAAADRIGDMFSKRYFNHVAPDGTQPWAWADKHGYRYRVIGENLAVGYPSANDVVDGWMHSPAHRANILKGAFDEIGIAVANGSPTRGYAGPTVVALYGSR